MRWNPFQHSQLEDAISLVKIISENAKRTAGKRYNPWQPEWDQSILPEYEEDLSKPIYTPLNIVSASLTPKVSRQLLRVLIEDADRADGERYRDLFSELENETGETFELGSEMPESWTEERRRGKRTYRLLDRFARDFEIDADQVRKDFGIKRRKRRRIRKRRHRRFK